MADESPNEKEERLNRHEDRLQKQHARVQEARKTAPSGGSSPTSGVMGLIANHKIAALFIGAALIAAVILLMLRKQSGTTGTTTGTSTANQTPNLAGAGYQDVGTAYALDQLTKQLNTIQQQLNQTPVPTVPPPAPNPPPVHAQTVFPWLKGTKGASSNFYQYTIQKGDTLDSLNKKFKWGAYNPTSANNNVYQYRNNAGIFAEAGINPTQKDALLPVGTVISA